MGRFSSIYPFFLVGIVVLVANPWPISLRWYFVESLLIFLNLSVISFEFDREK